MKNRNKIPSDRPDETGTFFRNVISVFGLVLSISCATDSVNPVSTIPISELDREHVLELYGTPTQVSSDGVNELLHYREAGGISDVLIRISPEGKVLSFGSDASAIRQKAIDQGQIHSALPAR
ncbi:MAG: hypothetical protein LR011_03025 [Verrucomicrobia bacterium]|nr:hypothetical protein [Verrucomicrobiota bacterium]